MVIGWFLCIFLPFSQWVPVNPSGHLHTYAVLVLIDVQVPPFLHGLDKQGLLVPAWVNRAVDYLQSCNIYEIDFNKQKMLLKRTSKITSVFSEIHVFAFTVAAAIGVAFLCVNRRRCWGVSFWASAFLKSMKRLLHSLYKGRALNLAKLFKAVILSVLHF